MVAALAALLVLPPPAATAQSTGDVEGSAVLAGPQCSPAAGVSVLVGETQTVTSGRGTFEVAGLAPGEYDVTVSPPPAYETATTTVAVESGETAEVALELAPATLRAQRVAGTTRMETAIAASQRAFPDGAPAVVIATAGAYPDALVAAPLAVRLGGPLLLVDRRSGAAVLEEVGRLGAEQAVIIGAINGVTAVVQAELLADGLAVRRIAGQSRFDTAALVARELGASPDGEIALTTGLDFADALSFAAFAAARGIPILLTLPDELPADTVEAIDVLGAERTIVLGGVAAVGAAVAADVPSAVRVAGNDRYDTSAAIARLARDRGADLSSVYIATGTNWPDALAAGPVAAKTDGPLLLVGGFAAKEFLVDVFGEVDQLVAFGGPAALPRDLLAATAQPAGPEQDCG